MNASARLIPASLLAIVLMSACHGSEEQKVQQGPIKVTVQQIDTSSQRVELSYSGTIEPDNTVQVGFAVPGVINNVAVQEGQAVAQGQLLATIDATEYTNALAIANAGLEQAEDMYTRLEGLYNKGSLPAKDYIDIKTKLAQAKANKSINAKRIADSKLYAPMRGIVTAKLVERGSTAAPGVPAFTIVKTDLVYAKIAVPESEVGKFSRNMDATVYIPTLNDTETGKISIINPQADANSKTYSIKIQLRNERQRLLPGMIANVQVSPGTSRSVIVIPATAVIRDADDLTYVYVVNEQHKAVRKRIFAGNITGKQEIVVTDGLKPGDKVVTAGHSRIKDGSPVSY